MEVPRIIIAGAPASGKGTQCEFIKAEYNCVHLSTGDMLRAAVAAESALGKEAKSHMDSGELVPDQIIIDIIIARLAEEDCKARGWLLDGFPRTRAQADALAAHGLSCDAFLLLDVPDHLLVERVCGRRSDPVTGQIYHITYKPPENDEIAARLTQRSDDTEEAIMIRVQNFHANVASIIDAYSDKVLKVNGARKPEEVWAELQASIPKMRTALALSSSVSLSEVKAEEVKDLAQRTGPAISANPAAPAPAAAAADADADAAASSGAVEKTLSIDIDEASAKAVKEKADFFTNKAGNDAAKRRISYKAPEDTVSPVQPVREKADFFANKATNDAALRRASYRAPEEPLSPEPVKEKANFFANKAVHDAALKRASNKAPDQVAPEIALAELGVKEKAQHHREHIDVAQSGKRTGLRSKYAPVDAVDHVQASKDIRAKRNSMRKSINEAFAKRGSIKDVMDNVAKRSSMRMSLFDNHGNLTADSPEEDLAGDAFIYDAAAAQSAAVKKAAEMDIVHDESWSYIYQLLERLDREKQEKERERAVVSNFGFQSIGLSVDAARVIAALADRTSVSRFDTDCYSRTFGKSMQGISRAEFIATTEFVMPKPPLGLDAEITKLYHPGTWEDVFKILHAEHDGTLSWTELANLVEINTMEEIPLDETGYESIRERHYADHLIIEKPGGLVELGLQDFATELKKFRPTPPPGFIDELAQLQVVSSWHAIFDIFDTNSDGILSLEQGRMFLAYFYDRNIRTVLDDHVRGINMPGAAFDPPLNLDGISKTFFASRMQQINMGKMPSARYVANAKRFMKFPDFYWGQLELNPTFTVNPVWFGWGEIFDLLDEDSSGDLDLDEARAIVLLMHSQRNDFITDADIRGKTPESNGMNLENIKRDAFVSMLTWVQPVMDYMLEGDVKHLLSGPTHDKIFDLLNVSKSGTLSINEAKVLLAFNCGDSDTSEVPDEAVVDFFSYPPFYGGDVEISLSGCTKEEFVSTFKRASPRHPSGCIQMMKQIIIRDTEKQGLPVASILSGFEDISEADVIPPTDEVPTSNDVPTERNLFESEPAPEVVTSPARPSLDGPLSQEPPARPSLDAEVEAAPAGQARIQSPSLSPPLPSPAPAPAPVPAPTKEEEEEKEEEVMNPLAPATEHNKAELPPRKPPRAADSIPATAQKPLSGGAAEAGGGCCIIS